MLIGSKSCREALRKSLRTQQTHELAITCPKPLQAGSLVALTGLFLLLLGMLAPSQLRAAVQDVTTSIADGDWNDPGVWDNGVPTSATRAIIGQETTVNLGGEDHVTDELIIHGTLNVPEGTADTDSVFSGRISFNRGGVAVDDDASGLGHLMYSGQNVQVRFGIRSDANSNIVAVRFFGGDWQYNDNRQWINFTPRATDRLVANVDFDFDAVEALERTFDNVNGISSGYVIGDLSFQANQFNGGFEIGEFSVSGGEFIAAASREFSPRRIGRPRRGVGVADDATGEGFLLHTNQRTYTRFGTNRNHNSNVVAVRFNDGQWQYNDNFSWIDFRPRSADRLIAAVDFDDDTVTSLKGSAGIYEGIQSGFVAGNITFEANRFDGRNNVGEFTVNGREFLLGRSLSASSNRLSADKTLTARFIHVNSDSRFQIGTQQNRFNNGTFTVTLTGTEPDADPSVPMADGSIKNITNNDGFLFADRGGSLQFFGEDRPSFTKLAATAEIGASEIQVATIIERNFDGDTSENSDGRMRFKLGDEIAIASSTVDYRQEEVRTVTSVSESGGQITLGIDRALTNRHYGEIETYDGGSRSVDMRAEVALLSRNVVVTGLASQDTDNEFGDRERLITSGPANRLEAENGIGGHVLIYNSAGRVNIDGIQLDLLGQTGRFGRFPMHWYFGGDRQGDVFRNSSITNSNNRGVVVHGTDNVLIEGIVLHDVHGHGFFLESGVEAGNEFIGNLALGIHRVGTSENNRDPFIVDVHDRTRNQSNQFESSSSYWIISGDNTFVGNISAGAQGSGYWFGPVGSVLRPPASADILARLPSDPGLQAIYARNPLTMPVTDFRDNSAHSSRLGMVFGGIDSNGFDSVDGGRDALYNLDPDRPGEAGTISNYTVYKTNTGYYAEIRDAFMNFENYVGVDNNISLWDTGPTRIEGGLFVGSSRGNGEALGRNSPVAFFRYFDQLELKNLHFARFGIRQFGQNPTVFRDGGNRNKFDTRIEGFSYDGNTTASRALTTAGGPTSVPTLRPVFDRDGSLTTRGGGGAGYSLIRFHDFWYDGNDGDHFAPGQSAGRFSSAITRKQFAGFHLVRRGQAGPNRPNVRLRITNERGGTYEFGGVNADEPLNSANNRPFINDPRTIVVIGQEYSIEPVRPVDLNNENFRFGYMDWGSPENSVSNVFRFIGGASQFTPVYSRGASSEINSVNSLQALRNATETSYFRDNSSGDLYMKLFNATENTAGSVDKDIIHMTPFSGS